MSAKNVHDETEAVIQTKAGDAVKAQIAAAQAAVGK